MTFIPERVHPISIYFFAPVHMIPRRNSAKMLFPYESFLNEIIPVFISNEILVLVRNFILVSCKLKKNFVLNWQSFISHLARTLFERERLNYAEKFHPIMWMCECIRTSFWNETHSGIKLIRVSHKQPLNLSACNFKCPLISRSLLYCPSLHLVTIYRTGFCNIRHCQSTS